MQRTANQIITKQLTIKLPWPPSVNTYWRRNGGRYFISKKGMDYRQSCLEACVKHYGHFKADQRLQVLIEAYPPDRRKRDIDNLPKAILDGLGHAQIYSDDSQIDKLTIWRCMPLDGLVVVTIAEA